METPLKNKMLTKLQQGEPFQTPVASSSAAGGADRSSRHISSVTKLPASPFLKKLGFGTGVEVLRIKRSPTKNSTKSPWAIKMLSRRNNAEQATLFGDRLTEEANILKTLSHPNIVGYRGFDTLEQGKEFIAMEYCNTSLGDMLENRYNEGLGPLEAPKILRMSLDILSGLDYLHTEALILHGDLKSYNVLVKGDFEVCKLCDFGVSLPLNSEGFLDTEKKKDAQYVGTGIWSAPEVLEEDASLISSKADIFSFGLVVYETVALLPPHTFVGMKDKSIASSADYAIMKSIIRGNSGNAVNRKLDVSEVIVLDDETEDEKDTSVVAPPTAAEPATTGTKRKLSRDEPVSQSAPVAKKAAPELPDSTTADNSVISVADDSIQKVDESAITIDDDDDEEDNEEEEALEEEEDEDDIDEDEEEEEDAEEDDEEDYLDYGRLGTRPAIPDGINLSEEYNFILEVFYVCTQEDYEARPSAKSLLEAWSKRPEAANAGGAKDKHEGAGEVNSDEGSKN